MERRSFLRMIAGCGVTSLGAPAMNLLGRDQVVPAYFGLHPFIEAHPEAVFIRKTNVLLKNDSDSKKREGYKFAEQVFSLRETPGIPVMHKITIKPNLTATSATGLTHAIITDPFVVEGLIEGLKQMGIPAGNIYARDGLMVDQPGLGYSEMARRTGVHYADNDSRTPALKESPDGVVFKLTKYLGPFNYPDSYLINVSKFKAHAMGLTLCVKNLQGTNIPPYIQFCNQPVKTIIQDFQPDWQQHIDDLHAKHERTGLPRWNTEKGPWMERWIQRTLDNYSLIRPVVGLNIIEGVYAQNGNGFTDGPSSNGGPDIFMTNALIFGKDAFTVDIIGHWLGGHEPGNFGLFHIARERGVSTALNPRNIPVYLWEDNGPRLTPLEKLARTPLTTLYMPKSDEPKYHLCNEPFSYPSEKLAACLSGKQIPGITVLGQRRSVGSSSSLLVEYNLPTDGYATVELYDSLGGRIGVLAEGRMNRGVHMAEWNMCRTAPGTYYCRLKTNDFDQVSPVTLPG